MSYKELISNKIYQVTGAYPIDWFERAVRFADPRQREHLRSHLQDSIKIAVLQTLNRERKFNPENYAEMVNRHVVEGPSGLQTVFYSSKENGTYDTGISIFPPNTLFSEYVSDSPSLNDRKDTSEVSIELHSKYPDENNMVITPMGVKKTDWKTPLRGQSRNGHVTSPFVAPPETMDPLRAQQIFGGIIIDTKTGTARSALFDELTELQHNPDVICDQTMWVTTREHTKHYSMNREILKLKTL